MNQVTELIDRESTQRVTPTYAPRMNDVLAQPGTQSLVAFRVGYPVRTALRRSRRPVDWVTR